MANFCKQQNCLRHPVEGFDVPVNDLVLTDTIGVHTGAVTMAQSTIGGFPSDVIPFNPVPVTAILTDSVSYVDPLGGFQVILLPLPTELNATPVISPPRPRTYPPGGNSPGSGGVPPVPGGVPPSGTPFPVNGSWGNPLLVGPQVLPKQLIGLQKTFILLSDGNVTIAPMAGVFVNLFLSGDNVVYTWDGSNWIIMSAVVNGTVGGGGPTPIPIRRVQDVIGNSAPNIITYSGPPVTTILTDSVSYVSVGGNVQTIILPTPTLVNAAPLTDFYGLRKTFIMTADGTVTIVPSVGSSVTLNLSGDSAEYSWDGTSWDVISSISKGVNGFNIIAVRDAWVSIGITGPTSIGTGSGFFLSADGYIVTAAHVVLAVPTDVTQGFNTLSVHVMNFDNTGNHLLVPATVVGYDGGSDVAVIKIPGVTAQNFFNWGNSSRLTWGSKCTMIGYENTDYESPTFVDVKDPKYFDSDGFEVAYNRSSLLVSGGKKGNSGGPLLDYQNNVVGVVNTGLFSDVVPDPGLFYQQNSSVSQATTYQLNSAPIAGEVLTCNNTNEPLQVDGFTVSLNEVILAKDQPDQRENGVYKLTRQFAVGIAWQLTRVAPFDQASIGVSPIPSSYLLYVVAGTSNAGSMWRNNSSITQVNPLLQNWIWIALDTSTITKLVGVHSSTATSQYQAQPIIDSIIAQDRTIGPVVLDPVFLYYTQKAYLGGALSSWNTFYPTAYGITSGRVDGMLLVTVTVGGPLDTSFNTAFVFPPNFLSTQVNTAGYPIILYSLDGVRIGCQDDDEFPASNVLYNHLSGDTINAVVYDPFGAILFPPNFLFSFPLTLGTVPLDSQGVSGGVANINSSLLGKVIPKLSLALNDKDKKTKPLNKTELLNNLSSFMTSHSLTKFTR